jgi:hypothetical protein
VHLMPPWPLRAAKTKHPNVCKYVHPI